MNKEILTLDTLDKSTDDSLLASGIAPDNADGLNMTGSGELLRWVAIRGAIGDWCMYTHWEYNSMEYVMTQGDKVMTAHNIRNVLEVSDEVMKRYRY